MIGAALTLAPAAIQGITGIAQMIKGARAAKNNKRPTYSIPKEIQDKLSAAQMNSLNGLPEASKQLFIQNIQRSQNLGLEGLSDRKSGVAGLSGIVQAGNDASNQLMAQDAEQRIENQRYLGQVQSEMAGYKDRAFDINQMSKYQENAAAASAMKGAGMQNIYGGLSGIASWGSDKMLADTISGNKSNGLRSFLNRKKKSTGSNFMAID